MKLIYQNFDALDVTFQGILPEYILEQLAAAREQAQKERKDAPILLGKTKMPVLVAESGLQGGFRYRFDTGVDGEIWGIAHSNKIDTWNIRVSVKSEALAIFGYKAVKNRLLNRLKDLEAVGSNPLGTGLLERVSRFDYCFDFVTNRFEPVANQFIAHQRCKKHEYIRQVMDMQVSSHGEIIDTLRIGKMPNRQVTLYNKTKEILDKGSSKKYWHNVWPKGSVETGQQVWRLEIRAGKEELNKWDLKRFADFEQKAGDVLLKTMQSIRYVTPAGGANRSRWPMADFYRTAYEAVENGLQEYISHADRERIYAEHWQDMEICYRQNIVGNAIGLAALMGCDLEDLPALLGNVAAEVAALPHNKIEKLQQKLALAEQRYQLLGS